VREVFTIRFLNIKEISWKKIARSLLVTKFQIPIKLVSSFPCDFWHDFCLFLVFIAPEFLKRSSMTKIEELHQKACDLEQDTYIDPESGYMVLTSKAHLKRGVCCGNVCRHCPFNYQNVPGIKSS
jgi:Family of unknown function (DUF5522)